MSAASVARELRKTIDSELPTLTYKAQAVSRFNLVYLIIENQDIIFLSDEQRTRLFEILDETEKNLDMLDFYRVRSVRDYSDLHAYFRPRW